MQLDPAFYDRVCHTESVLKGQLEIRQKVVAAMVTAACPDGPPPAVAELIKGVSVPRAPRSADLWDFCHQKEFLNPASLKRNLHPTTLSQVGVLFE